MKKLKKTKLSQIINSTLVLSKKSIAVFTVFAMISTQVSAKSWLESAMADKLGGMSNVTSAKAFNTSTRGVVSGGSIQTRNKIFNDRLINFVPPSMNAGCNGIDIFMGSFSFINADELVQLFRSIASNALGFLFQLALDVVAPKIAQLMQKFSDIVRELNKLVSDSCRMAKGVVNLALDSDKGGEAFQEIKKAGSSIWSSVKGMGSDIESWFETDKTSKSTIDASFKEERKDAGEIGNLTYNAMTRNKSNGVNRTFASRLKNTGFSDGELEEIAMSLTGFLISTEVKPIATGGAHGATTEESNEITETEPVLTLKALVEGSEGGNFTVYKCDEKTECRNPTQKTLTDKKGFTHHIYKLVCNVDSLLLPCNPDSPINKLATNNHGSGAEFSDDQKNALLLLPDAYRDQITKLQVLTGGATKLNGAATESGELIKQNIHLLGLNLAYEFANEIIQNLAQQTSSYKGSGKPKLMTKLEKIQDKIDKEYMALSKDPKYGDVNSMYLDLNRRVKAWENIPNASAGNVDPTISGNVTE